MRRSLSALDDAAARPGENTWPADSCPAASQTRIPSPHQWCPMQSDHASGGRAPQFPGSRRRRSDGDLAAGHRGRRAGRSVPVRPGLAPAKAGPGPARPPPCARRLSPPASCGESEFLRNINELKPMPWRHVNAFWLASAARILYRVVSIACERCTYRAGGPQGVLVWWFRSSLVRAAGSLENF
jgi:hypothetical protein